MNIHGQYDFKGSHIATITIKYMKPLTYNNQTVFTVSDGKLWYSISLLVLLQYCRYRKINEKAVELFQSFDFENVKLGRLLLNKEFIKTYYKKYENSIKSG